MVPLLDTVYGLAHEVSVGTSSAMIVSTALSSSFAYARQKRIDYKIGTAMIFGTIPTAYLGGQALGMMKTLFGASSSDIGRGLFGVFLILLALRMMFVPTRDTTARKIERWAWEQKIVDSHGHVFNYRADVARGLALSVLAGFASGFFGVGGGAVTVPIMTIVMHIPMHIAVATSMFTMILTSMSSTVSHLSQGNVILAFTASLSVGIIAGTQLGAWPARRSRPKAASERVRRSDHHHRSHNDPRFIDKATGLTVYYFDVDSAANHHVIYVYRVIVSEPVCGDT